MKKYKAAMAIVSLVLCLMMVSPSVVRAWDSHDYIAAPPGTNLLIWYYQNISAAQYYVDNKRVGDLDVHANVGILRMLHFTTLPGTCITIDPQFLLPFGYQFANGLNGSSGLADLILAVTFWFVNDPANKQWFGVTPYVFAPTGDYDSSRALNLGNNRWAGRLEAGYIKGWGNWMIDVGGSVEGYTNNNRYGANQTLKQDPMYRLEAHLTYDIVKNAYIGLEYYFMTGGKHKVDDVDQNDEVTSHALAIETGIWTTPQYQWLFTYKLDLDEKNGPKANMFQLRFLYAF